MILGVLVSAAFLVLLVGMRGHRPQGPPTEPVTAPGPYVWLPCHGLACGHLTTRHLPIGDGNAICRECGSMREDSR